VKIFKTAKPCESSNSIAQCWKFFAIENGTCGTAGHGVQGFGPPSDFLYPPIAVVIMLYVYIVAKTLVQLVPMKSVVQNVWEKSERSS